MMPAKPNTWTYQQLSYLIVSDALLHKDANKINHLNLSRSSRCFAAWFLRWRLWCNQLLANIVSWDSVATALQMLCWMFATNSDIHQSSLANPYPFHPSWRRRCFAAWSPQNQISICCMITTQKKTSIKPTSSLPISYFMASQILCYMISTKSVKNQST